MHRPDPAERDRACTRTLHMCSQWNTHALHLLLLPSCTGMNQLSGTTLSGSGRFRRLSADAAATIKQTPNLLPVKLTGGSMTDLVRGRGHGGGQHDVRGNSACGCWYVLQLVALGAHACMLTGSGIPQCLMVRMTVCLHGCAFSSMFVWGVSVPVKPSRPRRCAPACRYPGISVRPCHLHACVWHDGVLLCVCVVMQGKRSRTSAPCSMPLPACGGAGEVSLAGNGTLRLNLYHMESKWPLAFVLP